MALSHEEIGEEASPDHRCCEDFAELADRNDLPFGEPCCEAFVGMTGGRETDSAIEKVKSTFASRVFESQTPTDFTHLQPLQKIPEMEAVEVTLNHPPSIPMTDGARYVISIGQTL
jgi:hypothetical protein